jgi:hypothetical protein
VNESDPELRDFIEAAMPKGASDRLITDLLKTGGWSDKEIFAAFREYYEQTTGIPVPVRRVAGESARDAFLYLIAFSTLATWTINLGSLLFGLIDRWFPDPVALRGGGNPYRQQAAAFPMACILVAFPVFLYVTRKINQTLLNEPRNRNSPVRKWLTYLALVIAAGVLIGDAVAVLAYFLQGEVTLRFVLKVIVVGLIAAGVFRYYLGEVREPEPRRHKLFGFAAIGAVLAAVILGFTAMGGPSTQRAVQADVQRVRGLYEIAEAIRSRGNLPESLDQVPFRSNDPETGARYEYRPLSSASYELCATFASDNRLEAPTQRSTFWLHGPGRRCFQFDVKMTIPPAY